MVNLGRLFPNVQKRQNEEQFKNILYIAMVEWGWSYDKFIETPIPIIKMLLDVRTRVKKEEKDAMKK